MKAKKRKIEPMTLSSANLRLSDCRLSGTPNTCLNFPFWSTAAAGWPDYFVPTRLRSAASSWSENGRIAAQDLKKPKSA